MHVTVIKPLWEAFFIILTKSSLAWYSAITIFTDKAIRSKIWGKKDKAKDRRLSLLQPSTVQKSVFRKSSSVCISDLLHKFNLIILFHEKAKLITKLNDNKEEIKIKKTLSSDNF